VYHFKNDMFVVNGNNLHACIDKFQLNMCEGGEWENRRTDFWLLMKILCMEKNLDICSSYNAHLSFETYENNL
jgi:hypothetical protein